MTTSSTGNSVNINTTPSTVGFWFVPGVWLSSKNTEQNSFIHSILSRVPGAGVKSFQSACFGQWKDKTHRENRRTPAVLKPVSLRQEH